MNLHTLLTGLLTQPAAKPKLLGDRVVHPEVCVLVDGRTVTVTGYMVRPYEPAAAGRPERPARLILVAEPAPPPAPDSDI